MDYNTTTLIINQLNYWIIFILKGYEQICKSLFLNDEIQLFRDEVLKNVNPMWNEYIGFEYGKLALNAWREQRAKEMVERSGCLSNISP